MEFKFNTFSAGLLTEFTHPASELVFIGTIIDCVDEPGYRPFKWLRIHPFMVLGPDGDFINWSYIDRQSYRLSCDVFSFLVLIGEVRRIVSSSEVLVMQL